MHINQAAFRISRWSILRKTTSTKVICSLTWITGLGRLAWRKNPGEGIEIHKAESLRLLRTLSSVVGLFDMI